MIPSGILELFAVVWTSSSRSVVLQLGLSAVSMTTLYSDSGLRPVTLTGGEDDVTTMTEEEELSMVELRPVRLREGDSRPDQSTWLHVDAFQ